MPIANSSRKYSSSSVVEKSRELSFSSGRSCTSLIMSTKNSCTATGQQPQGLEAQTEQGREHEEVDEAIAVDVGGMWVRGMGCSS